LHLVVPLGKPAPKRHRDSLCLSSLHHRHTDVVNEELGTSERLLCDDEGDDRDDLAILVQARPATQP
jgi:hypothetical protein